MYLSKLELNPRFPGIYRDLGNAHALHQRIMQAFPDEQRATARTDWRILFRHEPDSMTLLVQSDPAPAWERLPQGYLAELPAVKEPETIDKMLSALTVGQILQFRIKANPSKRDKQTHKTVELTNNEDRTAWLARQERNHGFCIHAVDWIPVPHIHGRKSNLSGAIRIGCVLIQGILEIRDRDLFVTAFKQGIGRGKAYGCGLLSIAKVPG